MTKATLLLSAFIVLGAHGALASSIETLSSAPSTATPSIVALGASAPEAPDDGTDPVRTAALPVAVRGDSILSMGTPARETVPGEADIAAVSPRRIDDMPLVLRGDFGPAGKSAASTVTVPTQTASGSSSAAKPTYNRSGGAAAQQPTTARHEAPVSPADMDR